MLPEKPIIILDTNILFSALLRSESNFADVVFGMDYNFFIQPSSIPKNKKWRSPLSPSKPQKVRASRSLLAISELEAVIS
ncbi:MAG: hypothetical protein ACFCUV_11380 [Rivularia sp. (in: cyanobacteria)]